METQNINFILVDVLNKWLMEAKNSKSIIDWINENQMWIYPEDANYVVYGYTNFENTDFGCELFLSNEFIVLNFETSTAINTFLKTKQITIR
ncbi:MAG: hypothetical protein K6F69_06490 [Treponema sp.]|nr:hypothetical protein [Treponema sp.]